MELDPNGMNIEDGPYLSKSSSHEGLSVIPCRNIGGLLLRICYKLVLQPGPICPLRTALFRTIDNCSFQGCPYLSLLLIFSFF
jgi:hypothetical protein